MMLQSAVLLWAITLVTLPYRFSFLLHILKIHICFSRLWHCLGTLCWHSDWLSPKTISYCQIKSWNVWSGFFCSTVYLLFTLFDSLYIIIIADSNNIDQALRLLLVEMISPPVPNILPSDAFVLTFFDYQLGRQ